MFKKLYIGLVLLAMTLTACAPAQTPTQNPTQIPTKPAVAQPTTQPTATATPEPLTPIKIKVGLFPYGSYLPFYIAQEEGYYAEQALEVEFVNFTKQPDAIAALASGQIDVIGVVLDSGSLTAIVAGTGIKMVADKGYVQPNGCPYSAWMVRNELYQPGPLDDLAAIRGLKAAVPKAGFFEYAMDKLLEPVGLSTKDLDVVDMPAPTRLEALGTGAIDVAQMSEPWITRALKAGSAKIWYPFETTQPNAQLAAVWYGPTLMTDNIEGGNRFMVAYLKAVRQYNEGKTDRNVQLMADFTKSSVEESAATCWQPLTPDGSVNIDFILDFQQWALAKGYMDKTMTAEEFWDGQFLEYAQEHLQ